MTTLTRLTPAQRDAAIQALERARDRHQRSAVAPRSGHVTDWRIGYWRYHRLVVKRIAARLRALRGEEERDVLRRHDP